MLIAVFIVTSCFFLVGGESVAHRVCGNRSFQCDDGSCIPKASWCDGVKQCHKGEDENNCQNGPIKTRKRINTGMLTNRQAVKSTVSCHEPFEMIGGRCVMFEPIANATWVEARYVCERFNADLVILDSIDFYNKLIQHIHDAALHTKDYWVGGNDTHKEGEWKWLNGANITMGTPLWAVYGSTSTTYEQEPRSGSDGNCGCLDKNRFFYMDDDDCTKTKATICQIPTWSKKDSLKIPKIKKVNEGRHKKMLEMANIKKQ